MIWAKILCPGLVAGLIVAAASEPPRLLLGAIRSIYPPQSAVPCKRNYAKAGYTLGVVDADGQEAVAYHSRPSRSTGPD